VGVRGRPRRPSGYGGAGAAGCGSRPTRRRDRSRNRRPAGRPGDRRASAARGVHRGIVARPSGTGRTSSGRGRGGSRRQAVTTLGPARLDDRAPGACRHPMTESVALGPTAGVRLVRALHSCLLDPGRCRRPARDAGRLTRRAPRPAPDTERSSELPRAVTAHQRTGSRRIRQGRPGRGGRPW
jgi:hypothetical protein